MDREKVIYDIERCICHVPDACRDCSHYGHGEVIGCMEELLTDALALLKEDCHNCKLECLLQKYDELKEKYDALLKEQERKKGSWDYGTQCSVCKGTIVPPWKRDTRVNFCQWCGADMRGGYDV